MGTFFRILFLALFVGLIGVTCYRGFENYQNYSNARSRIEKFTPVNSNFSYFNNFNPVNPSINPPIVDLTDGKLTYLSPFSPCLELTEDRNWQIYASKQNLLPGYTSRVYYDRFWHLIWVGLTARDNNPIAVPTFYGPFRLEDIPKRGFVEYILIGKDVLGSGGEILLNDTDPCGKERGKLIQVSPGI